MMTVSSQIHPVSFVCKQLQVGPIRVVRAVCGSIGPIALLSPTVIEVSWIISEPIDVREGEGVRLELFAQAFGVYATPIGVGVICAEVIVSGVPAGADNISSTDTLEHAIIYHSSPICLQPSLTETLLS